MSVDTSTPCLNLTPNSSRMPMLGLGTYRLLGSSGYRSIRHAIELGYRHIDTASKYQNETIIGQAIQDSGIAREQFFVTTKCWLDEMGATQTPVALENSLQRLGLEYVDQYLMHWPDDDTMHPCWDAMCALRDQEKARTIGISNFSPARLKKFLTPSIERPAIHQHQCHIFNQHAALRLLGQQLGIASVAYGPIARAQNLEHPVLTKLAHKHHKTTSQIMLRWCLEHGMPVLPKSSDPDRLSMNADIFDFTLAPDDLEALTPLDQGLGISNWLPDPKTWY